TLICSQLVIFTIHSVFIILIQMMHLWKYLSSVTPCDIVTSAITCTILRFPLTTSYISLVLLQFMMVLERLVAMFRKADYEKSGWLLGATFVLAGVLTSAMVTLWSIQPENFSNSYAYCSSGSTKTIERLTNINISLCVICALSLVGTLLLRIYNKYALD
ncbi:hypothetical protein TELCIR_16021, partial [Teladorsagia circumcincta]